jgi:hypothetical protein
MILKRRKTKSGRLRETEVLNRVMFVTPGLTE